MSLANSQLGLARARERRRDAREKLSAVVYLTVESYNGGILLDLSEGGMCISVANPLRKEATIQFTLGAEEHRAVEGTGRLAWLSESGKSAGVEFVHLPHDSPQRIREWLAGKNLSAKEKNDRQTTSDQEPPSAWQQRPGSAAWPTAAGAEDAAAGAGATATISAGEGAEARPVPSARTQQPPSHYTLFAPPPPRPEAVPAEEPSPADERRTDHMLPETPLFFLPRRREFEGVSPLESAEAKQPFAGDGDTHTARDGGGEVAAFRSAIASGETRAERKEGEDRIFKKILAGVAILTTLLALGVGLIFYYPATLSGLSGFTPTVNSQPARQSTRAANSRRPGRRVARRRVPTRNERGNRPVRDIATFYAQSSAATHQPAEMTDRSNQRWLARVTSQRVASIQAGPAAAVDVSASPQPQEQMGDLRADGALVEEGAVAPTYAPLNLDAQTPGTKPIVVEAVIGKDGGVRDVHLISAPASRLAQALVEAVKRWRYRPVYRSGQPVEFTTRITFDFSRPISKP